MTMFRAGAALAVVVCLSPRVAAAEEDEGRFAVADISPTRASAAVLDTVERETAAQRRGWRVIQDAAMRTLLRNAESPAVVAGKRIGEARARYAAGDCPATLAAAAAAEAEALQYMWLDAQREPLKEAYELILMCEHRLNHEDRAAAAARNLRHLAATRPESVPQEVWDRYQVPPAEESEIEIDSDPPNAHVTINFREGGFTPRTLKAARGPVLIQLEKRDHRRELRRVELGNTPVHLTFRLTERRTDRGLTVRDLIAGMRGREPERDRDAVARLAQLARADVLVLVSEAEGTVRIWTFDAERGEIRVTSRQAGNHHGKS